MHDKQAALVALITGSSDGIGAAVAKRLNEKGFSVVIHSNKSVEKGQALADSLDNSVYMQADITDADSCHNLVNDVIKTFGRMDILVNNAAYSSPFIAHQAFDELDDEVFRGNFETNVLAAWRLAKLSYPFLKISDNANIINISSIAGLRPLGSSIAYSVSKAGLNQLTKLLAKAMAPEVRVNAIAPGITDTSRVQGEDAAALKAKLIQSSLMQRIAKPDDIAKTACYFIENNYVSGEIIALDGGTTLVS